MPEVLTSSTVGKTTLGANLSLLKGGTISQTIVGAIVSASVIASLVVTIVMISVGAGVQNPSLKPDYYEVYKKTPSKFYPLVNDIDPRGGNLTILNVTQPLHGKAVLSSASLVIYQSSGSYSGNDTFDYVVTNGWTTATSTVYINVLNRVPDVVDMAYIVNKNSKKNSFDLLAYESETGAKINDIDGDDLTITDIRLVSSDVGSTISFDQNYVYYTPAYGFNNIETLNYTITDGYANVSAVIQITVANDKPTADPDTYTISKNVLGTFNILDNDYDINGDNITISSAGTGSSGIVLISSENDYIEYIPKPFVAPYTDAFEYEITDGALTSSSYVFVKIVNSPPTVADKTFNVAKNSKNNLLDLTFADPDILDTVTLSTVSKLSRGNSSLSVTSSMTSVYYPTGDFLQVKKNAYTLVYTPDQGVIYTDSFKVKVSDGVDTGYATITINVVPSPPVPVNDTITCQKNDKVSLNVISNDYSASGDVLKLNFESSTSTYGGKLVKIDDNNVQYIPAQGFIGKDEAPYVVINTNTDGSSEGTFSRTGYVIVNVENTAPVAVPLTITVSKGLTSGINLLKDSYDPNGDSINYNSIAKSTYGISLPFTSGNSIVNYAALSSVYVDYVDFTVVDIDGAISQVATATINVVNDAPVPVDDVATVSWNRSVVIDVLANDKDVNGDSLTVKSVSYTSNNGATITVHQGGNTVLYTPMNGFVGNDTFSYVCFDGIDSSVTSGIVTVVVSNTAPTTSPISVSVHWKDTSIIVPVLTYASDIDGDSLHVESFTQGAKGSVSRVTLNDGSDALQFTTSGSNNFVGSDSFTFVVSDYGKSSVGTVNVQITDTAPVATDDSFSMHWRSSDNVLSVLSNDADANNDAITVKSVTKPQGFTGTIANLDSHLTYTPTASSVGTQTFTYTATDGPATSNAATVTLTVTNKDTPQDKTISKTVHWSTQSTGTVIPIFSSANPVDADGDSLSISSTILAPSSGSITISNVDVPNIVYKQTASFLGTDTFKVQITDGAATAIVTISVTVYDNAPLSNDVSENRHFTEVSGGYSKNAISFFNVTDADSQDSVSVTDATVGSCGSVSKTASTVTFTSTKGSTGVCVVSVTFTDGLLTSVAKWNINVQNVDPVASPITTTVHWNKGQAIIDILSTLSDADNDALSYSVSSSDSTFGSSSINSDKALVWTLPQSPKLGTTQIVISFTDGWVTKTASYPLIVQNNAPTAVEKTISSKWSACVSGITVDILASCSDLDNDNLSFDSNTPIVTGPTQGSASIVSSKVYYKQSTASVGSYSITYKVSDGIETATNTITIKCEDNAPVASADSITVNWNTSFVNIDVLANDVDSDNDVLSVTNLSAVSEGSLTNQGTSVKYTLKNPPTLSAKTFTYKAFDGALYSSAATVTVNVVNSNKPSISDQSTTAHWRTVKDGVSYTVYNTLTDNDGDYLSLSFGSGSSSYCSLVDLSNGIKGVKYARSLFASSDVCKVVLSDGYSTSSATLTTNSYNNAPVAANFTLDYSGGNIQYGITVDVLSSATDADIQDVPFLTISGVGASKLYGGAANIENGQILYFPDPSLVKSLGVDTVSYTISDGLYTSTGYLTINIKSTSPSSTEQYYNVHFRYSSVGYVFTPLTKIPDATKLDTTVLDANKPNHGGSVSVAGDEKTVTYKPSGSYLGNEVFKLTYYTASGNSDITFTMNVYDTAPIAQSLTGSVHFGKSTTFNLTSSTSDADPLDVNNLSFSITGQPTQGTLGVSSNIATYTASSTVGTYSGIYGVTDSMKSSTGSITITVTNTAPTTQTKTISVPWRTFQAGFTVDILNQAPADFDADGDSLSLVSATNPSVIGTVTVLDATRVTIKGSGNYVGTQTFKYIVTDGASNGQVTTTVNLIVYNTAPVGIPDKLTTHWNVASKTVNVIANDTDAESDPLSVTSVYGSLSSTAPTFTSDSIVYYPRNAPSTDTVYYTVYDGVATSTSYVSVTVTNNAPTTTPQSFVGPWSTAKNGLTFNVVAASSDANGDSLSLQSCSSSVTASQGNVTCSGNVKFTPTSGFVGSINPVTYVITDGRDTVSGTVSITITNNAPTANTTNTFRYHWRTVLSNTVIDLSPYLKDIDGDAVTLTAVTKTLVGVATLGSSNTINYKVNSAYTGSDAVTVSFTDGWSTSSATFNIAIYNTAPVAQNIITSTHLATLTIPVIGSGSNQPTDADGTVDSNNLVISSYSNPSVGSVSLSGDKKTFTFTNVAGNVATQTFTYVVSDGKDTSASKTVTISIVNSAPVATPITISKHWATVQSGLAINLLSVVTDSDLDTLSITSFTQPNNGAVTSINSTSVKYTPTPLTAGFTTTFTYSVYDGYTTISNTVSITITNTPPVAVDDTITVHWTNNTLYLKPVVNDYDVDFDYIYINKLYPSTFMNAYASMGNYIIISKGTTIVNNFASVVVPGSVATAGFVNQVLQPTGSLNVNNAAQLAIVNAASSLYQSLASYTCTASLDQSFPASNVLSFSPGVYCFSQGLSGSGTIQLSGAGLYIFSISTNLNANFQWSFTNGASAANVYWLVGAAGISGTFYGHVLTNGQLNFNNVVQNGVIMSLGSNSLSLNSVTFGSVVIPTGQTALELQADKLTVYYKNTFINGPATDSFQYTITDQIATSNVGTVKLVFTNAAPVATSFSAGKVSWKNTLTTSGVVTKYCSDADKDTLSLFGVTQGRYGATSVTDTASGTIVYTPSSSITYTSVDSNGASYVTDSITFGCYDGAQVTYNTFSVIVYNTAPKGASKSVTVQRDTSNPTVTLSDLLTGATDAEGDSISVSGVSMVTQNTGASVLLSSNIAKLTYTSSYLGSIVFSFTLTDGQLSSTYNYNVTIIGAPFYCIDYTITTTKDSSAVTFETDLKSKLSSYCVNDVCTLALASTSSLSSVGTVAANANNLLTYTQNSKSSSTGDAYATYSYSNKAGQSSTCKIIINQPNNAPTVYDYTYSYSISRASNDYITFDYVSLSSSDDPDASDTIVLSSISSVGTCTTSALSSLAISSDNQIKFLRNPSFIGSCSFSLVVSDSDLRNPISKTAKVTITAISSPPVAVNDAVSTTYNTYIDIPVSTLLSNDYDSLGGTFSFNGISCPTGDSSYCTAGTPTILNPSDPANNRIIRVQPIKGSCNSQKFVYSIKSDSDSTTATAIVTVSYTKCTCSLNMDIVFVLDGSSSIDSANWINMQNFASNLTTGFGSNISPTGTNIGIIQFSTTVYTHLKLSDGTSKNAVLNAIAGAGQLKSSTNSILGINSAVSMMVGQGRKDITRKLLIHITDGMSNLPCGLGACRAMYGNDKSLYGSVPTYCKSPRFPGGDATICQWNEPLSRCNPCSDATLRSTDLNSWAVGGATNPEKSTYGSIWNWRQLVVGIGDGLSSGYGQLQVQKMNYDPNNLIVVDWSDLSSVYQTVIDNSCNLVDSTQTNVQVPLSSSGYSVSYLGKTLSQTSFLNYAATVSTFTYRVTASSSAPALQRFTIGLQAGYNQDNFVNYVPYFPVFIGKDSTTNLDGFTFLSLPNSYTVAPGSSYTYSLTIAGDIPEGIITYGLAGGSQYTQGTVKGPSGVISSTTTPLPPNVNYGDNSSMRKTYCSSTKCYFFTQMNYSYRIEAMSKICKYWAANATLVQIQSSTEKTLITNNILEDYDVTFFLGTKDSDIAVGSTTTWQDGTSMSSYTNYQKNQPGSNTIIYASFNSDAPTGTWWKGGSYDTSTTFLLCQFKK